MKKFRYTLLATLALLSASSCKKYIDVNTNPNAPVTADASALLPPIQAGMARGVWFDSRYIGQYAQVWGSSAANNVWDEEGYLPATDNNGEMWRTVYFSLGQNITLLWQDALPKKKWDYVAVGYALRAWGWQTGGDLYDHMIVKEAFDPSRLTFDYDDGSVVYAEVVKDCQIALNYMNLAIKTDGQTISPTLAKGDYMYYGDRKKWIKFIYAILAQNALHLSNKASFSPDNVKKYADSSFVNNGDNASVECKGSQSGDSNFWGPSRGNIGAYKQSDFIVRLLDGRIFTGSTIPNYTLDPRIKQIISASKDGVYRGVIGTNGDPNAVDATTLVPYLFGDGVTTYPTTAPFGQRYIYNDNSRGVLMTYSEIKFFVAEAMFKKGDLAGAYAAYLDGIKGSLDFVSNPPQATALAGNQKFITDAAITAYLQGPCVKQSASALTLADIMQQKFISLYVWGSLEAWADERRYNYDTNIFQGFSKPGTLYPDNGGKQVYLVRPRYNSEYIWNVPALKTFGGLDPDYHTKKPWFILP
ncbi:MAG: SusD/RagB family nutrient-binding outer membrane lipoprotein [Mucilaginibacter sp.]|uniref:SusD/RagB family nutrient-binding outer membrane lipoprotein n=1 Tax=Mucilaginibacter sp. TaxID=1882438 RepID=UPI0031A955F3